MRRNVFPVISLHEIQTLNDRKHENSERYGARKAETMTLVDKESDGKPHFVERQRR